MKHLVTVVSYIDHTSTRVRLTECDKPVQTAQTQAAGKRHTSETRLKQKKREVLDIHKAPK
jgi:hypothetical protein